MTCRRRVFYSCLAEYEDCPNATGDLLEAVLEARAEAMQRKSGRALRALWLRAQDVMVSDRAVEATVSAMTAGAAVGLPVLAALSGNAQYALELARAMAVILGPVAVVRTALG